MTIGEYASKWAVVEHNALKNLGSNSRMPSTHEEAVLIRVERRTIFFEWAKDDPESPIAEALKNGTDEDSVEDEFNSAYGDMLQILWKLDR
jgi:hypothetical protein